MTKGRRGRPSTFSDRRADCILHRLAEGEALTAICRDATMPGISTVYDWKKSNSKFAEELELAQRIGLHALQERQVELAENPNWTKSVTEWLVEENAGLAQIRETVTYDDVRGSKRLIWLIAKRLDGYTNHPIRRERSR